MRKLRPFEHIWSGFWPTVKGRPFGDAMNAATKYMATHTAEGLERGPVHFVSSNATPTGVLINTYRRGGGLPTTS